LRATILARDRHACTRCGAGHGLEVQHVDGNWRNGDAVNLGALCG